MPFESTTTRSYRNLCDPIAFTPFRTVVRITVYNSLHTKLPLDRQALSRLSTTVGQYAITQIGLFQVGNVNERHAPGVETKQEDVASKHKRRSSLQIQIFQCLYCFDGNSPFDGFINSRIDMAERIVLHSQTFLYSPIVSRPQNAHIKRNSVLTYPPFLQPCLVSLYKSRIYNINRDITLLEKRKETSLSYAISFGSTHLSQHL